jgi:hypothetical protein
MSIYLAVTFIGVGGRAESDGVSVNGRGKAAHVKLQPLPFSVKV